MTLRATSWVWMSAKATGLDKLVLLAAADWASDEGDYLTLDVDVLAAKTGMAREDVLAALARSCDTGDVERGPEGTQARLAVPRQPALDVSPSRPPLRAAVRAAVMDRDYRQCQICGTYDEPTVDHIVPVSAGGSDDLDNLQVLCRSCNSRKGARL